MAPRRACRSTSSASNPSSTVTGVPGHQRPGHHGQTADVGQRQAGHPAVAGRIHPQARPRWPAAEARTASWVRTTPLGSPLVPLVATTRASPASTGRPAGWGWSPPASTTVEGRRASTRLCDGRPGETRVEGQHGVAGVPGGLQGLHEAGAGREVERYQLRHGGSLGDRTSADSRSDWSNGCTGTGGQAGGHGRHTGRRDGHHRSAGRPGRRASGPCPCRPGSAGATTGTSTTTWPTAWPS